MGFEEAIDCEDDMHGAGAVLQMGMEETPDPRHDVEMKSLPNQVKNEAFTLA